MSPFDIPAGLVMAGAGFAAIAGFMLAAAVRAVIERWRR